LVVKRKTEVCYYVMKLAEYGELYSFIEHTERFDEGMTRYIFDQVLEGVKYLHSNGIVHRDIKPENLLINKKGRVLIADFSFATRMKELENDGIFKKTYEPIVDKKHDVGSEAYNAPEIWDNEINLQEFEQKFKAENDDPIFDYSAIDSQLRNMSVYPKYNGEKADSFSIGACLFMISMKTPPFRKAVSNDPYFKRLISTQKINFWKIFKGYTYSPSFRELIEKTLTKFPAQRFGID
jgi:serine/threonine protein kinase